MVARPHKTFPAIVLLLAIMVPLLTLLPDRQEPVAEEAGNPAFGLYAPGTLNDLPPGAGRQMLAALGMETIEEYQDWSLGLVRESGAGWARIDFRYTGWGFDYPAYLLDLLPGSGIATVGCIRPVNRHAPADLSGFEEELRRLLERYPWIEVWQIGNEPDLGWDDPGDFTRFFLAAATVVREVCPGCRVALAGAAALFPVRHDALAPYDQILGAIAAGGGGKKHPPFDIIDLHFYDYAGAEREILASVQAFRSLLARHGLPPETSLWVTENASPTGQPTWPPGAPAQSEEQQAGELVRRFVVLMDAGAERVSWARPYENYRYGEQVDGFYDSTGLVYNGLGREAALGVAAGARKPAFFAYQTLARKTRAYTGVVCLAPGRYRFDFSDGRPPLYVLWDDRGGSLPDELAGTVTVTEPDGGKQRVDAATVSLGWMPVMVEGE